MWLGFLPMWTNYTWFLSLGIMFVVLHMILFGFGVDQSYFGIVLILIGLLKPSLYVWFINLMWILIVLDIVGNIRKIYDVLTSKKKNVYREKLPEYKNPNKVKESMSKPVKEAMKEGMKK